jgi:predicted peptidase
MTRREILRLAGTMPMAAWASAARTPAVPALAPGTPASSERRALVDAFQRKIAGLADRFEKRAHRGPWAMPYRLFRPASTAMAPLVVYLHGSGGLGDDNEKQLGLGNVFGTHVWALPENQERFPCYVLAPQTDRGWSAYQEAPNGGLATVVAGFGEGARVALDIAQMLTREFRIDERRIYLTGQSMGGAGVWNLLAHRPNAFAAAVVCCGSATPDAVAPAAKTPIWNFHGDADRTVPVAVSRAREAALTRAGGHPIFTEYPGVDHPSWEWAYTEPALPGWLFTQRR